MRVITGSARGVRLSTPDGMDTRPTSDRVKEGLFSAIQFEVEGRRVLDLFAGTGQLGIEALSRGAAQAVFVDQSKTAVKLVQENLKRTRLEASATVLQSGYAEYLSHCRQKFDLIFLDPPYAEKFLEDALSKISEFDILTDSGIIITERPTEKPISETFGRLTRSREYRYGKIFIALFRKETE